MERLAYSSGGDRLVDSSCLQNTVKKLVSNLCETLIIFKAQLKIEGTVGITIDEERVIVLHFGESIGKSSSYVDRPPDSHADRDYSPTANEVRRDVSSEKDASIGSKDEDFPRTSHISLTEEMKTKCASVDVSKIEREDEVLHVDSPESARTKKNAENSTSYSEILDSLLSSSRSDDETAALNSKNGHPQLEEGATLLDMTTDILSNLFGTSSSRESFVQRCNRQTLSDKSQIEMLPGVRLKQGSAIEALRQIYCKQFTNRGKDSIESVFTSGILEPTSSTPAEAARGPKSPGTGKRECSQNQVLLRELLFQKTTPLNASATNSSLHQPVCKRRRIGSSSSTSTTNDHNERNAVFSEVLRSNRIGETKGDINPTPASKQLVMLDEVGSRQMDCLPELGQSGFPPGFLFDQGLETDNSKYKFSQLLFSLVDSRRNSLNNPNVLYAGQGTSGSSTQTFSAAFYHDACLPDGGNIKQEADDLEFGAVQGSPYANQSNSM